VSSQIVRTLSSSIVYEDNWIRLRKDEIERPNGLRGTYAVVEKPDFALVIPAQDDGFHLVEEFRYPIGRRTWSFPQGGFPRNWLAWSSRRRPVSPRRNSSSWVSSTAHTASPIRAVTSTWPPV
jgi:hypothetical protein